MAWNDTTPNTEVGDVIRSVDITNIQNNITAQANGDAGAPQNQTASYADGSVTAIKLASDVGFIGQPIAGDTIFQRDIGAVSATTSVGTTFDQPTEGLGANPTLLAAGTIRVVYDLTDSGGTVEGKGYEVEPDGTVTLLFTDTGTGTKTQDISISKRSIFRLNLQLGNSASGSIDNAYIKTSNDVICLA
jgi:hypothetical protein